MAKDPAFLFYPSDWLSGTMGMTFEEKGAYMELLIFQFNNGDLTEQAIKRVLNVRYSDVWPSVKDKFKTRDGKYYNERLAYEQRKRREYSESRRTSRLKADEDNVKIYLIRDIDTGYFKIGSSVNPMRRFAEMVNQKNPAITVGQRNYELFWVSPVVFRSEEKRLHSQFSNKNVTGEWFELSEADVQAINNTYKGTFEKRTSLRTENEIVNENGSERRNGFKNDAPEFEKYIDWTNEILDGNSREFEVQLMNEHIPMSPNIPFWVRDHLGLLERYPKMQPANKQRFIGSVMKHVRENYKKPVNTNGAVNGVNKTATHTTGLKQDFAERHGNKAK